jgi:hypothetical protein
MSNFTCEICGTQILDSSNGFITECIHWPLGSIWSEMELEKAKKEAERIRNEFWKEAT